MKKIMLASVAFIILFSFGGCSKDENVSTVSKDASIKINKIENDTPKQDKNVTKEVENKKNELQKDKNDTSIKVNESEKEELLSAEDYEKFLLPFDIEWSKKNRPFGVHYCGSDPHRHAESYAKIPYLDFLDVGWGGDVKVLRKHLPNTFLNIRLSPVELVKQSNDEIRDTIIRLVNDSNNPYLTGVCCINMDDKVTDDKITTIFETVETLKNQYKKGETYLSD